jgi:hypothetical protein
MKYRVEDVNAPEVGGSIRSQDGASLRSGTCGKRFFVARGGGRSSNAA